MESAQDLKLLPLVNMLAQLDMSCSRIMHAVSKQVGLRHSLVQFLARRGYHPQRLGHRDQSRLSSCPSRTVAPRLLSIK